MVEQDIFIPEILTDEHYGLMVSFLMTCTMLALIGLRNVGLLIFKFKSMVYEVENWVDMLMCILVLGTLITSRIDIVESTHVGSFSVITLWLRITFLIGRYYTLGVYIYMSNYIFLNLAMFFTLYLSTIWGKGHEKML